MDLNEIQEFLEALEKGHIRSAQKNKETGLWEANTEVKKKILEVFKEGKLSEMKVFGDEAPFVDKHTLPLQKFSVERGIRIVPGGSSVRRGAYIAPGVIIMPPAYINIGAFVDEGSMVDSHALVGSCAQIGKRVHLSAAVQIGGVLEPIGASPVVIEDDAFIGAGSIIVEGIVIGQGAVIAPGVILSKGVSVFDAVKQTILERGAPIPPRAVVVPGMRKLTKNSWCEDLSLHIASPIIIKYRDEKSDAALTLENALR